MIALLSRLQGARMVPERLRVSIGTASVLGLTECWLDEKPTTAYLMTYAEDGCIANCAFCPQARGSLSSRSLLSRVLWPDYITKEVVEKLKQRDGIVSRVCIQAVNYTGFFDDILAVLREIVEVTDLPVSLDTMPLNRDQMETLRDAGLDRISIPLDAATPELFDEVKGRSAGGPYTWEGHLDALSIAVDVFGEGRVFTNLIIGLGETEEEAVGLMQRLMDAGVMTALYAFTPVKGTKLADQPQPNLNAYRRIQLARHLITKGLAHFETMDFGERERVENFGVDAETLESALADGEAFRTSGCPGCNRPYYNERPSGPFYNYPRSLMPEEARTEAELLELKENE
jgi:biotin synthase-related radical SAM superfamily protein